jgi:hypothetical protein
MPHEPCHASTALHIYMRSILAIPLMATACLSQLDEIDKDPKLIKIAGKQETGFQYKMQAAVKNVRDSHGRTHHLKRSLGTNGHRFADKLRHGSMRMREDLGDCLDSIFGCNKDQDK